MSAKKMTFEQGISRLEQIVALLERGDAPLADSLALFEEGTKLVAACSKQLDQAGNHAACEQVMAAVADFDKGNMRLSLILASLDIK